MLKSWQAAELTVTVLLTETKWHVERCQPCPTDSLVLFLVGVDRFYAAESLQKGSNI